MRRRYTSRYDKGHCAMCYWARHNYGVSKERLRISKNVYFFEAFKIMINALRNQLKFMFIKSRIVIIFKYIYDTINKRSTLWLNSSNNT